MGNGNPKIYQMSEDRVIDFIVEAVVLCEIRQVSTWILYLVKQKNGVIFNKVSYSPNQKGGRIK
jgi:hypothetical protein